MRKKYMFFLAAVASVVLGACGASESTEEDAGAEQHETAERAAEENAELPLSDMIVRITSQDRTAVFQLYDTKAAAELYEQLPLELELSNFSDAQWMFYPPEKLDVDADEVYRNGKKGELSYYEPWGDVFMLYEDFQSGDDMHRLGVCLDGIDNIEGMSGTALIEQERLNEVEDMQEGEERMQISVENNGNTIIFELNDSQAATDLYEQLPLTIETEDFSDNEKIFYPPEELNTEDAPLAEGGEGVLAYYAPWGDVVMFYDDFRANGSLFELGQAVSGQELIGQLSGEITIEASE